MYNEKPIPVYHSKDELEPKQIYISTAGTIDSYFGQKCKEYMSLLTNEEIEKIVDEFNSIGCTSFMLPSEQIEELLEQYEKENGYGKSSNSNSKN